ncbi:MAG: PKD domain-containing protein, partial [Burkholderiales bacterium]|nr:PKD domain-containing protein [Burkholderiales bacterium]
MRLDVGNRTTHTLSNLAAGTTYQIAVTAYDASGAESAFSNVVSYTTPAASVPPVARFSASTTSGTAPLALNFVDESTGTISSYAWTFGDGTTSTARNPAKVYSSPGTYTVSLTVSGSAGSNTLTKSGYVTVSAPPPSGGSDGTVLLSQDFAGTSLAGWRVQDDGLS